MVRLEILLKLFPVVVFPLKTAGCCVLVVAETIRVVGGVIGPSFAAGGDSSGGNARSTFSHTFRDIYCNFEGTPQTIFLLMVDFVLLEANDEFCVVSLLLMKF